MAYFTQDFIDFFKELSSNNNKEWFHANKKRYEQSVKQPFHDFVEEIIERVKGDQPGIDMLPKDAIFRINKDIRFSKDKTPYKTHMAALVSAGGRKDHTTPGLYMQLSSEDVRLYSGMHGMETAQLAKVRSFIAGNLDRFQKVINAPEFKKAFGEILGEKAKRLPPDLKEAAEKEPLIFNKQLYYFMKLSPKEILKDDFTTTVIEGYRKGYDVNAFLLEALNS